MRQDKGRSDGNGFVEWEEEADDDDGGGDADEEHRILSAIGLGGYQSAVILPPT